MLKSWLCVYLGNFVGAMIIVFLILYSGQLDFSNGLLGGFTIKIAAYKTHLAWGHAFFWESSATGLYVWPLDGVGSKRHSR